MSLLVHSNAHRLENLPENPTFLHTNGIRIVQSLLLSIER